MKEVNNILRGLVSLYLIIIGFLFVVYSIISVGYGSNIKSQCIVMIPYFLCIGLMLYVHYKNKKSSRLYMLVLFIIGIIYICLANRNILNGTSSIGFIENTFSVNGLFNILPVVLIYISSVLNYYVNKERK